VLYLYIVDLTEAYHRTFNNKDVRRLDLA